MIPPESAPLWDRIPAGFNAIDWAIANVATLSDAERAELEASSQPEQLFRPLDAGGAHPGPLEQVGDEMIERGQLARAPLLGVREPRAQASVVEQEL
jgi:hypothetical protein